VTAREVWRVSRAGSLDRLAKQPDVLPPPGAGEARVRVEAIGLNFADIFACLGLYSATPKGPFVPGLEFCGVIEESETPAAGLEVTAATPPAGTVVYGVTRFGAYSTSLNVPVEQLVPAPPGWEPAQAAAFPVQGLTAYYGLVDLARAARDEVVLLHSAAGGVGLAAIAILTSIGARIIATVGSDEKRRFLIDHRRLPPELVIVRDRRRFADQLDRSLSALNAPGFDVVFDAVVGPFFRPALERLRPKGRLVLYGAADLMPRGRTLVDPRLIGRYVRRPRLDPLSLIATNRSVMGFNLIWLWDDVHRLRGTCSTLHALCPDPPLVGRRFPFGQARDALRYLQSGQSIGKVVLEVGAEAPQSHRRTSSSMRTNP
jgi:alcohol dehydrogenase